MISEILKCQKMLHLAVDEIKYSKDPGYTKDTQRIKPQRTLEII